MTYVREPGPPCWSANRQRCSATTPAPNPSETALAALGSCISVGMLANATHRGVTLSKIEVVMEGDIDISAVVGCRRHPRGQGARVFRPCVARSTLAGDADETVLREIHDNAIRWSPVVNTFRRPAILDSALVVE